MTTTPGKPWLVRLTCCGRADGVYAALTWEEADRFRLSYTAPGHYDDVSGLGGGHRRSAVIEDGYATRVAAPSDGLREALARYRAALATTEAPGRDADPPADPSGLDVDRLHRAAMNGGMDQLARALYNLPGKTTLVREYAALAATPTEDPGGLRAFWNGDEPRRIIVQLPPIGPDGRCTRCGSTPSRDTGSCRCHRVVIEQVGAIDDPVASLPYTLDAARVAAPSDGLVADRLARAFHEAKKVGGPWGPCAYRDATGDMVPVAFDDNSEDDFACLCRAMANHVVAEYAALAATPTDD
jgi:hypothetical protein